MKANQMVFLRAAVYLGGLFLMYHDVLIFLTKRWKVEDYNYCYLIPLVAIYLVWEKRHAISNMPANRDWWGAVPFFIGIALFWIGELASEYYTLFLSFWFVCVGLLLFEMGRKRLKIILFPVLFSITMFPFPNFIHHKFSLHLKLISSRIGVEMVQIYGLPAFREGNIIDLGFVQLQVVDACSGLRYLLPLLILSILVAYFYRSAAWKRIVIVLSSIPIAIFTNSIRIALTGIIYKHWGAEVAEGFFHGFSGWLIFVLSFILLMAACSILRLLPGRRPPRKTPDTPGAGKNAAHHVQMERFGVLNSVFFLMFAAAVFASWGAAGHLDIAEKPPAKQSFASFPKTIDGWTGRSQEMEEKFITALKFSDYVIVDYTNAAGDTVNFYVAYYESQKKGASVHSPSTCIPGSGWIFEDMGTRSILIPGSEKPVRVNQALIQKGNSKQLVFYWFPQRGRILTNGIALKIYNFWDALTRQRTDGALVRLITPMRQDETIRTASARLEEFITVVQPVLDQYIPD